MFRCPDLADDRSLLYQLAVSPSLPRAMPALCIQGRAPALSSVQLINRDGLGKYHGLEDDSIRITALECVIFRHGVETASFIRKLINYYTGDCGEQ